MVQLMFKMEPLTTTTKMELTKETNTKGKRNSTWIKSLILHLADPYLTSSTTLGLQARK